MHFDMISLISAVLAGLGFFALAILCMSLSRFDTSLAGVWLPNAGAASLLLIARVRGEALVFIAMAVACAAGNMIMGNSAAVAVIFTAANLLEILIVVALVRRSCGHTPDMTDLGHLGNFLLYGGLFAPLLSSAVASLALIPMADGSPSDVIAWFISTSMGMVLIVPAVLLITDAVRQKLVVPSAEMTERLAIMAGGYVALYFVFAQNVYPLLFLVPPITLLVAFRLGALGTAFYVPGIFLVASWMTYSGVGPIAQNHTNEISKVFVLQAFIAANFLTGLPIAAILAGRARMTEDMIRSRAELALLADSITDAVLRIDQDSVCTYASPSVAEVLGRDPEEFLGKPALARIHENAQETLSQTLRRLLDGEIDKHRITYRRLLDDEDGRPVYIEADCAVVYDPETGKQDGIVVSARDVTARIELETELKRARHRAEDAAHAKSEFLANMSHEIRTPMNGVLGFAELLIQGEIDESNRRHAEMIVQSGRSMMLLLNDILDLSKIEAGQITIDKSPVDPVATIAECLSLHRPPAQKKGLELNFHPPANDYRSKGEDAPEYPWLHTDGLRLRQIMLNLLGNAVKFTETGRVDIRCDCRSDAFVLEVEDTGIGVPPERVQSIFMPFTQGETDTARRFGGTGLGLTISQQLAELLGGTITVESEPGRGSVFRLTLPPDYTSPLTHPAAEVVPVEPPEVLQGGRVLLVEDHDVNRMLASEMLERCGQTVSIAQDGNEAIAMVIDSVMRDRPYDLVLMDIQMPGCDGYSATRAIRAEGIRPEILPIIALTANAFPEDIAAARKAGMQAHLAKPLVFAELARTLERWLPTRIIETGEMTHPEPSITTFAKRETDPTTPGEGSRPNPVEIGERPGKTSPPAAHSPELQKRWNARRAQAIEAVRDALAKGALSEGSSDEALREELARLVHKLAGTAAIFGEPELGDQAAILERALRQGTTGEIREALAFELLSVADDPADTLSRASN